VYQAAAKETVAVATTKFVILGFLILATAMEVTGDAIVRMGLGQSATTTRLVCFAAGAVLLFGYGLALNLAPIEFEKVVGIYIATLFVMWQIISFITFRTLPTLPILIGGAMIVAGGLVVAFWQPGGALDSSGA
jgi:small multidrug resistance family-3 protein